MCQRVSSGVFSVLFLFILVLQVGYSNLIDPTRPLTYQEAMSKSGSGSAMLLKSIIYGKNHQVAQMGDGFYQLGDKVGGYTIMEIMPSSVMVKGFGKTLTLQLIAQQVRSQ